MTQEIKEKTELCSKAFLAWVITEQEGKDMTVINEDIANLFTSRMILKKFEVFNIDIVLPDMLLLILNICTDSNPGQFQIILKDLLNNIKQEKGLIKPGYIITSEDFAEHFISFPIIEDENIYHKYEKLWDGQKKERKHPLDSDNLCDTPEWWREVME